MNTLYGLLADAVSISGWYMKKYNPLFHTDKSKALQTLMLSEVPAAKIPMFICVVCSVVISTGFGEEILALDPNNTYNPVGRPPGTSSEDQAFLMCDLIGTEKSYKLFQRYLDEDIKKRLVVPTWTEHLAAACLQILRETVK